MVRKPRIDRFGRVHPPRRTVPVRLLATVAVLLAISLGAREGLRLFIASFDEYKPLAMAQIEAGSGTTPVAQKAVLVIISGLRSDVSREMPTFEYLHRLGAQAEVRVPWPTISQAAWTTLLSGATPELSGAVALNANDNTPRPITVDHLLRRARITRHTTGLAGHKLWESLVSTDALTEAVISTGKSADDDSWLLQQAMDILATRPPDLLVIQLSQLDTAGHTYGGASDEYHRAAQRVDTLIGRVAAALDLRATALIITSDHGHLDQGGYGGPEPPVATVPLVIAGPGVKPGDYGTIDQTDIAPTLAALMGLPIPAESQGTIRFEMLDMEAPLQAEKAMALADQQVRLSDTYLRAIEPFDWAQGKQGSASGRPAQALSVARSAWAVNNVQGAYEIARQSDEDARQEMTAGRAARIANEREERLWIAVAAGAAFLIGLLWLHSLRTAWLVGAGLLAWLGPLGRGDILAVLLDTPDWRWAPAVVGTLLALGAAPWAWRSRHRGRWIVAAGALGAGWLFAYVQPESLSPSAIGSMEAFRTAMAWRSATALLIGGGAVLSLVWPSRENARGVTRACYWFVFLLTAGLIVELAAGYWLLGPEVTWYLPDADLVYWHLTAWMQTMLVAGLGIFLPAVGVSVALVLRRLQRQPAFSPRTETPEVGRVRP